MMYIVALKQFSGYSKLRVVCYLALTAVIIFTLLVATITGSYVLFSYDKWTIE